MQDFWNDLWRREEEFLASGKDEFRHDTSFVGVSTIAGQFYCEYKVENEFKLGEIPTETKAKGTELHDELMPLKEISAKEFTRLVSGKKPASAVLRVWGTVAGVRIIGMPDHIVWAEGRPLWLVELKTTRGDPTPLWEDQMNQARIYGLLLELMGFDCSRLRLAVIRLKTSDLAGAEKRDWITRVSSALEAGRVGVLESKYRGIMKVHLLQHDKKAAENAVLSKSGYWLKEREPTSSTSMGKCRGCEYNSVCPKTLYSPSSATPR